jgi:prepilin-type N-terminal cleavage/methylation domain-containing protein
MRDEGFTLVEVVIVMAISSLLFLIAFIGQRQLQSRARFDGAIQKTLQNIAYARNYAMGNVNTEGQGNDLGNEFAGAGFELDDNHSNSQALEELEPIYVQLDASGSPIPDPGGTGYPSYSNLPQPDTGQCPHEADRECFEQFLDTNGDPLTLTNATDAEIDFINSPSGLLVCHVVGNGLQNIAQTCAGSANKPVDLQLGDQDGHSATVEIEPRTGFAKRLN